MPSHSDGVLGGGTEIDLELQRQQTPLQQFMIYIKIFLAVTLLVAAQNTSTSAQTTGVQKTDEYSKLSDPWNDKCVSGNCVNGKGTMVYTIGDTYEGDFVNGKKAGHGTYTFKNGQVYVGQFSDNLRNGKGKFTFSDGSIYEGSFVNDNFIGHGIYTAKSGSKQTGKFTVGQIVDLRSNLVDTYWGKAEIVEILGDKYKVRNLINRTTEIVTEQRIRPFTAPVKYEIGQKVEVMDKGIWYKGEIIGNEVEYNDHYRIRFEATTNRSDMSESVRFIRPGIGSSNAQTSPSTSKCVSGECRNGFGKAVLPDGTTYEGNFVNVKANGKGKVINPDGSVYEGDFVNGKFEGQGTLTITKDEIYIGQFSNGSYNGKGKATFANGSKYDGDWVNGNKVGQGIFTFKNGEIYIGQFSNNVRNGKGKTTFPGGEIYEGNWVNDKRSGKGKTTFPNGDVYEGDYVDNKNEGQGTYTAKNGSYYIGEWKNGKQNGYGKEVIKATNVTREGTWKDGVLVNIIVQMERQ